MLDVHALILQHTMQSGRHCCEERSLSYYPSKPSNFMNHAEAALNYELRCIVLIHCTANVPILHVCSAIDALFMMPFMMLLSSNPPCETSSPPSGNQQNNIAHSCNPRTS